MKTKKLNLYSINLASFVTTLNNKEAQTIDGALFGSNICSFGPFYCTPAPAPVASRYPPCDNGTRPYDEYTETGNPGLQCACADGQLITR